MLCSYPDTSPPTPCTRALLSQAQFLICGIIVSTVGFKVTASLIILLIRLVDKAQLSLTYKLKHGSFNRLYCQWKIISTLDKIHTDDQFISLLSVEGCSLHLLET